MKKYFTGIGSRKTPHNILNLMYKIGYKLAQRNFILRSGGANGADNVFEKAYVNAQTKFGYKPDNKEIYLPWDGFNNKRKNHKNGYYIPENFDNYNEAEIITKRHHPYFYSLTTGQKLLMVRNTYQILGQKLREKEKTKFVVCWTPDGCSGSTSRTKHTGGTGQAISIANFYNINIYNLYWVSVRHKFKKWLNEDSI